jgi:hypothetical protein
MFDILELEKFEDEIDYLIEASPTILVETPNDVIKRIQRLEKIGVDEMILKIDNYGHTANMPSIEMFGKYVFRAINNPRAVPESKLKALANPERTSYFRAFT